MPTGRQGVTSISCICSSTIASQVDDAADLIAELAVQLGGVAHGTRIAAKTTGEEHVRVMVDRLSALANASRDAIDEDDKAAQGDSTHIQRDRRATERTYGFSKHIQAA